MVHIPVIQHHPSQTMTSHGSVLIKMDGLYHMAKVICGLRK
jgi:hypothetical protein